MFERGDRQRFRDEIRLVASDPPGSRAGRATSVELSDAETALTRSQLDLLNALIDARIAQVKLDYALGPEPGNG